MKKVLTFAFIACITLATYSQQIKSYDLDVSIDVSQKKVIVQGTINIDFEAKDHFSLVLWKNTSINDISFNRKPVSFTFETSKPTPIIWIDEGRGLIIKNPSNQAGTIPVTINYESDFTGMETSAESFTDEWIQIGFYNAWFPVDLNSRDANSKIRLSIDKAYKVSGSGLITKKGDIWEITQPWGSYDNVIIASKDLNSTKTTKDNATIETVYTDFSDDDITSIVETGQTVLDYFGSIYPKKEDAYIKFVVKHSANGGGGYNRPNFISLRLKQFGLSTKKTIAHEVAHFWATGANASSWQDWLNESFAEYSALLYIRDKVSNEEFEAQIAKYKSYAKDAPAIWNFDRSSDDAYVVLYMKGALILHELENKIGSKKFNNILKLKATKGIKNTSKFLNLLTQETSKETRNWLENALKS